MLMQHRKEHGERIRSFPGGNRAYNKFNSSAAWRVYGSPVEIRERYRKRFGIESSYRQMRQARIYTCTRQPHLRLFFVAVALILRNLWVWIHQTHLAHGTPANPKLNLECLRFRRMLDWIVHEVVALFHDGSIPCVVRPP